MGKLIKDDFLNTWKSMLDINLQEELLALKEKELDTHSFIFYTSVSVMSSSKIEGETLEIDSYVKHKMLNIKYLPELTQKPNDLYKAYLFAKDYRLNKIHFHKAHKLIAARLLPKSQIGVIRTSEMFVMEHKTNRIQYEAAPQRILKDEYEQFWQELEMILLYDLTIEEVFYFASLVHLIFVNIHPFSDGNGRIGRLLEKWFLAEKLGERAWYIQSEKFYYKHINDYYRNLARIGFSYDTLHYEKSIPFLLMLPQSRIYEG